MPASLSYDRFQTFTKLFTTYCRDYEALAPYYGGDYRDPSEWQRAAERASEITRDRHALAEVLLEQNSAWFGESLGETTRVHIEHLRDPESVAIVTGQQVGLLTGPLYTIYKTITTLQLAERFSEETGRPAVPVFWVEGEDHDFDEIAGIHLLRRNEPAGVRYEAPHLPHEANPGAVGRMVLTEAIQDVLGQIDELLPDTDFKPEVMRRAREAYRPGVTLEDAFVRFHRALFPGEGIVYLNPDDARLKKLAAPLFNKELNTHQDAYRRLQKVSKQLKDEGYHAQVHAHPTNLFLLKEGGRWPLDAVDGAFELRDADETLSREDLTELLGDEPEVFSPNVVLRPLMQDALLPTAAYVAGPGEIAYFAQYRPLYDWSDLPMPLVYPRAGVTLMESKVQKVLDRLEVQIPDLEDDIERVFQRLVVDEMDIEGMFGSAQRHLHEAVNDLKPAVEQVDRTLGRSAEATRTALVSELDALKDRVVRAEKRNQDEMRTQLAKAQANLFPMRRLQERVVNVLYYMNKYSPDLIGRLRKDLSLETTGHQVVHL